VKRLPTIVLLTCCCFAVGLNATVRQGPLLSRVSTTVDLIPGTAAVLVRITNSSTVPLDAWQIRLLYDVGSESEGNVDITYDGATSEIPGAGPIAPGATRERTFAIGHIPANASVSIRMAVFGDLSSDGSADEIAFVLRQRERQAEVLGRWLDALQTVKGKTPQQAKATLENMLASDPRLKADPSDSWAQALRLDLAGHLASPEGDLLDRVEAVKQRFARQRARALRSKAR
jgi:hypothetical protein